MILAALMSLMTILMMTTLIRSMIIISRKKSVKKVILSKWILLIWIRIKEKGGDDDCYSRLFFTKNPIFATM